ncbi:hypothetical protein JW960_11660 [candidate division KSB1 bacterium]|nr:hypothetical protein [candidate division KSB1 bacterium]
MKGKNAHLIIGATLLFMLGLYLSPDSAYAKSYELKVVKVDGVWKVIDTADVNNKQIKVKRNETVTWTADGSDVYFQFSSDMKFKGQAAADDLDGGYTKVLKAGKKLKLKVKADAPLGDEVYAAFVLADKVFAIGGSAPRIVIEGQ